MALLLMMKYLAEVSHIDHLTASLTSVEMISLVFGLSIHPVADNLSRLDHSGVLRVLDAVYPLSFIQSHPVGSARRAENIRCSRPS